MKPDHTALYITFCLHMRALAGQFDVSVTSWWRSEKRNAAKGGDPESFHLEGLGADLVPDELARKPDIAEAARALGLQVADEGDHLHVELDYRAP